MKALIACSPGTVIGPDPLRLPEHIVPHDLEVLIEIVRVPLGEVKAVPLCHGAQPGHFAHFLFFSTRLKFMLLDQNI